MKREEREREDHRLSLPRSHLHGAGEREFLCGAASACFLEAKFLQGGERVVQYLPCIWPILPPSSPTCNALPAEAAADRPMEARLSLARSLGTQRQCSALPVVITKLGSTFSGLVIVRHPVYCMQTGIKRSEHTSRSPTQPITCVPRPASNLCSARVSRSAPRKLPPQFSECKAAN